MKRSETMMSVILIVSLIVIGCHSTKGSENQGRQVRLKSGDDSDKELALKFLEGIQAGDKSRMYLAANVIEEMVNDSREKLVYSKKYRLSDEQRKEHERILRISGEIDFFVARLGKMLPKSSSLQIAGSTETKSTDDARNVYHLVKIRYMNKDEALRDKTGKAVKEMAVHLQQATYSMKGRSIREFSFTSNDYEKIANRDFEVLAYF